MRFDYSYGGLSPDVNIDYASSGSGGGYGDMYKSLMGGGGKDPFKSILGGGGGGYQAPMRSGIGFGGGGIGAGITGATMRGRSSGGIGGSIPTLTSKGAAELRAARETLPYEMQQQAQQQALSGQMQIAQMNARTSLAAQMMNLEAERQARLQAQIDNERNRAMQMEMQRRQFGADDYQTKQQFNYQYGI